MTDPRPADLPRHRPRPRRRGGVRVVDVALAVAVTAVGLAWGRTYFGRTLAAVPSWPWRLDPSPYWWVAIGPAYGSARNLLLVLILLGTTVALPGAVALVVLRRLRRPGAATPFWRARQPGEMASLIASALLVTLLALQSLRAFEVMHLNWLVGPRGEVRCIAAAVPHDPQPRDDWGHRIGGPDPVLIALTLLARWAGLAIAGAWLGLAAAGRWRPAVAGTERLGRLLGAFWIAAAFHFLALPI